MLAVFSVDSVAQLTVVALRNGAFYGLLGVGFALILGVTGRFHYAYGFTYALAAYLVFTFIDRSHLPVWPAAALGLLLVTAFGVAIEWFIYRPLAAGAGANALLAIFVASLGLGIAGENIIRLFWSSAAQQLQGVTVKPYHLGPTSFLNLDLFQLISAVVLVGLLAGALRYTGLGRAIKATRSNPDMARIIGLNPNTIYVLCFAIGTFMCSVGAFWRGMEFNVQPDMGFQPVVFAFVVAFLAGTASSPARVFIVGILVSLVEQYSSIWLSARWTQLAVFVVLVIYLVSLSFDVRKILARLVPSPRAAEA
ncbi:MAG: branched-chain amino acid ABC transporter permease [Acidimicrobiales bacterium]